MRSHLRRDGKTDRSLDGITIIVPYYRNQLMLAEHVREWNGYPYGYRFIVVDDGSPEPALPIVQENADSDLLSRLEVYRVGVDIPWNRNGARNLGSKVAQTEWLIHVDIDHLLPQGCAAALQNASVSGRFWYRFPRFRRGKADDTRKKDKIPTDQEFGAIHPHCDSYLCTKTLFWRVGGYDEDYSGCLGGGSPFLRQMEAKSPVHMLPQNVFLCVYTRDAVADASDFTLSRDTSEYSNRRRKKEFTRNTKPVNPIRFPWSRVL